MQWNKKWAVKGKIKTINWWSQLWTLGCWFIDQVLEAFFCIIVQHYLVFWSSFSRYVSKSMQCSLQHNLRAVSIRIHVFHIYIYINFIFMNLYLPNISFKILYFNTPLDGYKCRLELQDLSVESVKKTKRQKGNRKWRVICRAEFSHPFIKILKDITPGEQERALYAYDFIGFIMTVAYGWFI